MSKHLEEKRIEHLELKVNWNYMEESEIIAKQKEKISQQSVVIETMSQEIKSLNTKLQVLSYIPSKLNTLEKSEFIAKQNISQQSGMIETMSQEIKSFKQEMKDLNNVSTKLEWRITKLPDSKRDITKRFIVAGYHFEFCFCRDFYGCFQIKIRPLTGWCYEKIKWPFKAEFITCLNSQLSPKDIKEFKSEVVVVQKHHFYSDSNESFIIATISRDAFVGSLYYTDGVIELEIYVIFL